MNPERSGDGGGGTAAGRATNTGEHPPGPLLAPTAPAPHASSHETADQPRGQGTAAARTSKFTFYFTEEQLDRLDRLWETVRRTRRRPRRRVSKSEVVRLALDLLLADFERDPAAVTAALLQHPLD